MSETPQIVTPEDICVESVNHILTVAGLESEAPGDGAVWVKTEGTIPLKIEISERDKMLRLISSVGLSESSPMLPKYQLINELNNAVLIRFKAYSETCLMGEYYLSYERGLLPNQLILTSQLFQHIFVGVLRDKFEKGGVLDI